MESSGNYPSLLEAGMRKKKKKMARGEMGAYDPARAQRAEESAADSLARSMNKKMGIKRGKKS